MEEGSAKTELDELINQFKRDYYRAPQGKYNLKVQASYLAKLADVYLEGYQRTEEWTDILKAHALYNSVAVRKTKEVDKWSRKAFECQQKVWNDKTFWNYELQEWVTSVLKGSLKEIRQNVSDLLTPVNQLLAKLNSSKISKRDFQDQFISAIETISLCCTESMIAFTKRIFEFAVSTIIQQPPCSFCVVAFGSMAKGEATPYSDLEYMFLIERNDQETLEYFENLAISSYFIIGNLRETNLGYMSVAELEGWFDDKQTNGFKIDGLKKGAGNIPTGNGIDKPTNHLILTPMELSLRFKNVLDNPKDEAIKGDLTAMLQYTRPIYSYGEDSSKRLLGKFRKEQDSCQPNLARQEANRKMFIADANKYSFKPTEKLISDGFSINTKKDLYRYPSILLYNLSILSGLKKCNSWEALQSLHSQRLISESIYSSLVFLLACACYFRLSTYLFHKSADERLSVLEINYFSSQNVSQSSEQRWFLPQTLFDMHCDYSIPLKSHIGLCSIHDIENTIREEIQEPNWLIKFQTYHCCNRWSQGQRHLQEHISESSVLDKPKQTINAIYIQVNRDFGELWNSVKAVTYSLCEQQHYKIALSYHEIIQVKIEEGNGPESVKDQQLIVAETMAEAGDCYYGLTMFLNALQEYLKSLDIRSKHLCKDDEVLAKMHFSIAKCYNMMYEYCKAEEHLLKALQVCHNHASKKVNYDYYGDVIHSDEIPQPLVGLLKCCPEDRLKYLNNSSIILARVLWTLGATYLYSKYYERAFMYMHKAWKMLLELYGNGACHKDIVHILFCLGCASDLLPKRGDAATYFRKSLAMANQIYGKQNKFRAGILHFLAIQHSAIYQKLVLRILLIVPLFKVGTSQSANILNRFGFHLTNIGEHKLAEVMLVKSLEMFQRASSQDSYAFGYMSNTLANLALNTWKMGDIAAAEHLYDKSIEMLSKHGDYCTSMESKLEIGEILQSRGTMYEHIQKYGMALQCYQNAKDKFLLGCSQHDHPKILETNTQINRVGQMMQMLGGEEHSL